MCVPIRGSARGSLQLGYKYIRKVSMRRLDKERLSIVG